MGDDDQVRIRIRVRGTSSLKDLMRSAEDLKKQVLEDKRLWNEVAVMAEDLRRQIKDIK
jgi:hypothetical protein